MKNTNKFKSLKGYSSVTVNDKSVRLRNNELPMVHSILTTFSGTFEDFFSVGDISRASGVKCGRTVSSTCHKLATLGILEKDRKIPRYKLKDLEWYFQGVKQIQTAMACLVAEKPKKKRKTTTKRKTTAKPVQVVEKVVEVEKVVQVPVLDIGGYLAEQGVDLVRLSKLMKLVDRCGGMDRLESIMTDEMFTPVPGNKFENLTDEDLQEDEDNYENFMDSFEGLTSEFGDNIITSLD